MVLEAGGVGASGVAAAAMSGSGVQAKMLDVVAVARVAPKIASGRKRMMIRSRRLVILARTRSTRASLLSVVRRAVKKMRMLRQRKSHGNR